MFIKNKKLIIFGMVFLVGILLISFGSSYARTSIPEQYSGVGGIGAFGSGSSLGFDKSMCQEGTDFLMQISPFGCTPPVRSDLLEEQDVTVFCQIGATKINPLIKVDAINRISLSGEFSNDVRSVRYFPASSALGYAGDVETGTLNNPILENLGYVAITLRQNPNESSMPEFVSGNLSATLNYDIRNAYGLGQAQFYLPVLNENEWKENYLQYGFWQGRGFLRADSVGPESASISIYSDESIAELGLSQSQGREYSQNKFTSRNLVKGEESEQIYLPGFNQCLAGLRLRLDDIENPDTRVQLRVNGDSIEVKRGEKFLNNDCYVTSLEKKGLNQRVSVFCKEDEGSSRFDLSISPSVHLRIGEFEGDYSVGDYLYDSSDGERAVYLGYAGTFSETRNVEDLYVVLVALPVFKEKLSNEEISSIATHIDYRISKTDTGASFFDNVVNSLKQTSAFSVGAAQYLIQGKDLEIARFRESSGFIGENTYFGKEFLVAGFSDSLDNGFMKLTEEEYSVDDNIIRNEAGQDIGLRMEESPLNSNTFILRSREFSRIGAFHGENCNEDSCEKYGFKFTPGFENDGNYEGFFDNYNSIELIDDKIIVKRIEFVDFEFSGEHAEYYENAMKDFQSLVNSYANENIGNSDDTYGEASLYEAILLAESLNQKQTMKELCSQFESSYSNSNKDLSMCYDELLISNEDVSSTDVLIEGNLRRISLSGIYEPRFEDYGATLIVQGPNGDSKEYQLTKDKRVYLTGLRDLDATYVVDTIGEEVIYFRYDSRWYWSLDTKVWMNTAQEKVDKGEDEGKSPGEENLELIEELNGLNEDNGDETLIDIGARKETEEIENEYIELVSLTENTADIRYHFAGENYWERTFVTNTERIELDETEGIDGGYVFSLVDINLGKVAKVSIIPNVNFAESEAEFGFKVGIDKRNIQLSPEQIDNKITQLNRSIEEWNSAYETLDDVNTGLKTACVGTGAILTIKNLISNSGGKAIARQEVMQGEGGWNEICQQRVSHGEYSSLDNCYLDNSDEIDSDVQNYLEIMQEQDEKIKVIEEKHTEDGGFLGNDYIKEDEFREEYAGEVSDELYDLEGDDISEEEMKEIIETGVNENIYSTEDLRDMEFYSEVLRENPEDERARQRLSSLYSDVKTNSKNLIGRNTLADKYGILDASKIGLIETEADKQKRAYEGHTNKNTKIDGIPEDAPVYIFQTDDGKDYVAVLDDSSGNENLFIAQEENDEGENQRLVYDGEGNLVTSGEVLNTLDKISFKKYDETSYENKYLNPEIKYYETDPYQGRPSVVPFDKENGWYAYIKPTLPAGANIRSYDDSGRINSFYLCNVGENGLQEGLDEDICQLFNLNTGQDYSSFYGLEPDEVEALVRDAVSAIESAEEAHSAGVRNVRIGGANYPVGEPATNVPLTQCQDFMSPKECNLLFNVCDPVICPSSRCDLGGAYPVRDVIQSGVVGSVALCLPNFPETKIPICLTGVQAGIDGWNSVQRSYRDCLQTQKATGETVGICDEINSVYMCEFFYRQTLPILKFALPKIISAAAGEETRGGGEYLGISSAFENAQNSVEFFTQFYAANSNRAFKARSFEEAGGEVCKGFISATYPGSGNFLDRLVEPDSPVQFYGNFDEIPMSTVTNPPTSHYKVYYHIYAGRDRGAYYQVYLRDAGGSFYQDTAFRRNVDSGYIPSGESIDEAKDFTAPSGYGELCIEVNGQEECGFKQVSTSFSVDFLTEKYVASQADETDIRTERECVSGGSNLASLLLNPNVQSGVEETIDPAIYDRGIIRTCASGNPGVGSDAKANEEGSRWVKVGQCGSENLGCWLDTQSVKDVIRNTNIEDQVLNDTGSQFLEELRKSEGYLSRQNARDEIENIKASEENDLEKINLINEIIDKVFYNNQKAEILFLRGTIYSKLANEIYRELIEERKEAEERGIPFEDGATCEPVEILDEVQGIGDVRERILATAENYEGRLSYIDDQSCFGAVEYIYAKADTSTNCIYSDSEGKKYSTSFGEVTIYNREGSGINFVASNPRFCDFNRQNPSISSEEKLDNIKPGDLLSIVYDGDSPHSVIFVEWIDNQERIARVFDWNGDTLNDGEDDREGDVCGDSDEFYKISSSGNVYCKLYQYTEFDLSDDEHAVYQYWSP